MTSLQDSWTVEVDRLVGLEQSLEDEVEEFITKLPERLPIHQGR